MTRTRAEVIICGAGIAGIAAAYHLAVKKGLKNVVIVEQGHPFGLTSDKSTEAYRNWWPGPDGHMIAFMNRSIDLLEEIAHESSNRIKLSRRGYLFATAEEARIPMLIEAAEKATEEGAGELRVHASSTRNYQPSPEVNLAGADLITDPSLIRQHFPYLAPNTLAVLHARRAGWFGAQQLGLYMLEKAREMGFGWFGVRWSGLRQPVEWFGLYRSITKIVPCRSRRRSLSMLPGRCKNRWARC